MMRTLKAWAAALFTGALLVACGGGGGDTGEPPFGGGDPGTGTDPTVTYVVGVTVQRGTTPINTIASTETVKAVARVTDNYGKVVPGVVVSFSEEVASLLKFAPTSATALTGTDGTASVDISSKTTTDIGATEVHAAVTKGDAAYTGMATLQIQAGSVDNTPARPAAINFKSVSPADKAIVIKGAGGNGRSESATLTFQVVDASNTPIQNARVAFSITPAGVVTLNIPTGLSDANGLVSTTVQSGSQPATVTVIASAMDAADVTAPSDQLLVSNGKVLPEGFEFSVDNANLDYWMSGDKTTITARVRDASGNPVPDGLAVSFTTDYGVVASSDLGGCVTVNGECEVDYKVQEPRSPDGIATVVARVREGQLDEAVFAAQLNMAGGPGDLVLTDESLVVAETVVMSECKQIFEYLLADGFGHSPATDTLVEHSYSTPEVGVSIKAGSPVADARDYKPVLVAVEVDLTSTRLSPQCVTGGNVREAGFIGLKFTTPAAKRVTLKRMRLFYPQL